MQSVVVKNATGHKRTYISNQDGNADAERIYGRMLRPLCPPYLITLQITILFLAKILRTKTRYDLRMFQFLATVLYILIVP